MFGWVTGPSSYGGRELPNAYQRTWDRLEGQFDVPAQGFFGTGGLTTFENETQEFKVAHLRNAYQKVGMFGMPDVPFINISVADRQHGQDNTGAGHRHSQSEHQNGINRDD